MGGMPMPHGRPHGSIGHMGAHGNYFLAYGSLWETTGFFFLPRGAYGSLWEAMGGYGTA